MCHSICPATVLALVLTSSFAHAAVVTFDELAVGTQFGPPTYMPGDALFSEAGIHVSIDSFIESDEPFFGSGVEVFAAGGPLPGFGGGPPIIGSGNLVYMGNANLVFDFSDLEFEVTMVTIEWATGGGSHNLSANGGETWIGSLANVPAMIAPGVTAEAGDNSLTLTGILEQVSIGGQEFAIDNIAAIPAPGALGLLLLVMVKPLRRPRTP